MSDPHLRPLVQEVGTPQEVSARNLPGPHVAQQVHEAPLLFIFANRR